MTSTLRPDADWYHDKIKETMDIEPGVIGGACAHLEACDKSASNTCECNDEFEELLTLIEEWQHDHP